jgi:ssDNA-binding Zn-finger/Zn-ribbon topoisomerase 1
MEIEQKFFSDDPKFIGPHTCPKCGRKSQWKAIQGDGRIIRVECPFPECGIYEKSYAALSDMPFFAG